MQGLAPSLFPKRRDTCPHLAVATFPVQGLFFLTAPSTVPVVGRHLLHIEVSVDCLLHGRS